MKPDQDTGDLFDSICDELRPYCWPETFLEVAAEVIAWRKSRNPHHIDTAVLVCSQAGAPITPAVQAELARAANLRLTGETAGTARKVRKERVHSWALLLIANLHHAGLDVGTAARKVAGLTHGYYKPSTLEKNFGSRMRQRYEREYKPAWLQNIPNHQSAWREIAERLPEALEE
ncbi:hypothetical protein [Elongatibacter sediminis]|uniref:Uncharacterized protein n=1 Tax=Elongatibacter sediminis TaxID=3119006 RepID=A0AAW9RKZ8_9GAMM